MTFVLAFAGAACVLYGFCIMAVWSGTGFFAVWFALGLAFLAGAWALHAGWWAALPVVARRIVCGVACLAAAICLVTQGLALSYFGAQGEDDLDCIIVLGAQVRESGPSVVLRQRLDAAFDYLQANPSTRCIVSGGQGANEPEPEARAMARYLEERGIAPERIAIEDRSLNTMQNIANSAHLCNPAAERIGIVTNNFHVFRGVGIARNQGFSRVCGIAAPSSPFYLPNNLLRETFGIAKDFVQGNL